MENIEKAAKNNAITFQIGIAQMILMPVVNGLYKIRCDLNSKFLNIKQL